MQRITISFPEETLKELEKNAADRGISLARYLRQMAELGRQMDAANGDKIDGNYFFPLGYIFFCDFW
jgi:uncharacterized coiled-coil protein SlyX